MIGSNRSADVQDEAPTSMKRRRQSTSQGSDDETITCGIHSLLNIPQAFFSISWRPLLLDGFPGNLRTGCVVTTWFPKMDSHSNADVRDLIRLSWRSLLERLGPKFLERLVEDVDFTLSTRTDDYLEIREACKKYTSSGFPIAGRDEAEWLFPRKSPLRKFAFLRRLSMPMYHSRDSSGILETLDVSFLDLLLDLREVKDIAVKLLNQRLGDVDKELANFEWEEAQIQQLSQLHQMLSRAIERAVCSAVPVFPLKSNKQRKRYALPDRALEDHETVMSECERLLRELEDRKKIPKKEICHYTMGGAVQLPYRIRNGSLLVTEKELSYDEFVSQKKLMGKVNKKLKRQFFPGTSRPKMQKSIISDEALAQLRSIFFSERGCLRKAILKDIDMSSKHGYINFANAACRDMRNDYRWQVPLLHHLESEKNPTRAMIETLLAKYGCIDPEHETIHDLGILIGGTEDQSLHHDIGRQTTSWLPEDPEKSDNGFADVPVNGWEYDRAAYNEAMACPYAPSSMLVGMGETGKIQVGVQKNQIERYGCLDGWCRIADGKQGEQFRIVRETYYLVVLEASHGVIFTGDFQHAGVGNFMTGSPEDKLVVKFFDRIESIVEEAGHDEAGDVPDVTMEMIYMMCNFPGLYKICRFHCSTEPKRGPLRIPRNTVGFVDCRPNPPTDELLTGSDKAAVIKDDSAKSDLITGRHRGKSSASLNTVKAASVVVEAPPPVVATPCPLCNAVVQCPDKATLDEALSLHMAACQNSRARFKRAANHQNPYDE